MAIYGIADLHLDSSGEKPMDIFGKKWDRHEEKIFEYWQETVKSEDLVLIPGDVSWALKAEEAYIDLKKIDELPGKKVISKGNHDYWWVTKSKLESLQLDTIHFLYNDSFIYKDIAICGTRGWPPKDSDEFDEHDEKIYSREVNRLDLSLSSIKADVKTKVAMLHYPPFNMENREPNEFINVMLKHGVSICVYGHLHSEGHRLAFEGDIEGIDFYCISSDYIDFKLKQLL
jgi:uncharacterized protein